MYQHLIMQFSLFLPLVSPYVRSQSAQRYPLLFLELLLVDLARLGQFSFQLKPFLFFLFHPLLDFFLMPLSFIFFSLKLIQIKWVHDVKRRYFILFHCWRTLFIFVFLLMSCVVNSVAFPRLGWKSCRSLYAISLDSATNTFAPLLTFPRTPETSYFDKKLVFPLNLSRKVISLSNYLKIK